MRQLGRVLGVPRCGLDRAPAVPAAAEALRQAVRRLAGPWPTYGYHRLTAMLRREGFRVHGPRVRRVMAALGIQGQTPARRVRTPDSGHGFPRDPNRVADRAGTRPDHVGVADSTSGRWRRDFVYLAVLRDVFTRCLRGWALRRALDHALTLQALERALRRHRPEVHHADPGVPYAATAYVERLLGLRTAIRRAAVGEPEEHGSAERLMRTITEEQGERSAYQDFADAHGPRGRFRDDGYQRQRIPSSLGYLTPEEFAQPWRAEPSALLVIP